MMIRIRFTVMIVMALAAALTGCSGGASNSDAAKRYPMQGEIKAIDPAAKTATIAHGKIGDWMEAMTMEYSIKPDAEFQKLHVGDKIEATVVANDAKYYVTDIKVAPR